MLLLPPLPYANCESRQIVTQGKEGCNWARGISSGGRLEHGSHLPHRVVGLLRGRQTAAAAIRKAEGDAREPSVAACANSAGRRIQGSIPMAFQDRLDEHRR